MLDNLHYKSYEAPKGFTLAPFVNLSQSYIRFSFHLFSSLTPTKNLYSVLIESEVNMLLTHI